MRCGLPLLVALCGCRGILGIDSPVLEASDAGDDGPNTLDGGPDAYAPCPVDGFDMCALPLTDALPAVIDTTACQGGTIVDGLCAFHLTAASVGATRATGIVPLVVAVDADMQISATVDVSSISADTGTVGAGGNPSTCHPGMLPDKNISGGGGAGGGFAELGGNGGRGDGAQPVGGIGDPGDVDPMPMTVHGGCPGQGGARSDPQATSSNGGGAIWFVARGSIAVSASGIVNASGGGGVGGNGFGGGGAGGGAGGMIRLSSAGELIVQGALFASGGGGGGGGGGSVVGGVAGKDAVNNVNGGNGVDGGGHGGKGGGQDNPDNGGASGTDSQGGGGGGGGSEGVIQLHATNPIVAGIVIPAPT